MLPIVRPAGGGQGRGTRRAPSGSGLSPTRVGNKDARIAGTFGGRDDPRRAMGPTAIAREAWASRETRPVLLYIGVCFCYMLLEIGYGFSSHSLALVSDGAHMLFDVLAQSTSVAAMVLSQREPNLEYSYGYARHELLAVFANACFMLFVSAFVAIEGAHRLWEPVPVQGSVMVHVAGVGLVVNLAGAYFCHKWAAQGKTLGYRLGFGQLEPIGQGIWRSAATAGSRDHETARQSNVRLLLLHIAVDVLSSVGVIVVALADEQGRHVADPLASLAIAGLILYSVWPLAKRSGKIMLQSAPTEFRQVLDRLTREAALLDGVLELHHEHFWTHAPGIYVGSLRVRARTDASEQALLAKVHAIFAQYVVHLTVQIEKDVPLDLDWNAPSYPSFTCNSKQ